MSNDRPPAEPTCPAGASGFLVLVRKHEAMVHATARRITRDSALADDVVQETFLALARQPEGVLISVRDWLRRVAERKAINAVRSEARRRRVEEAATLVSLSPEESRWSTIEPIISQTLEELPPEMKDCLVTHYLEGRTQQEMASSKGISQSTISRQIGAGVRELKRRLRIKGILCGAGLSALWSGQSAAAATAPNSLGSFLGKLSTGGVHSSTSAVTANSTLIIMKVAKISLAIAATTALVGIPIFLSDRLDAPDKSVHSTSSSKSPSAGGFAPESARKSKLDSGTADAVKRYRPAPVSEDVRLKVDALIRRLNNLSDEEKMRDPEFSKLMQRFIELVESLDENSRLDKAITGLMSAKGIGLTNSDKNQGMPSGVQTPLGHLEDPVGRSWLEAVVSNDRDRVEDWMVNRFDGAAFEFAFDPSLERTSEGVALIPPVASKEAQEQPQDGSVRVDEK